MKVTKLWPSGNFRPASSLRLTAPAWQRRIGAPGFIRDRLDEFRHDQYGRLGFIFRNSASCKNCGKLTSLAGEAYCKKSQMPWHLLSPAHRAASHFPAL